MTNKPKHTPGPINFNGADNHSFYAGHAGDGWRVYVEVDRKPGLEAQGLKHLHSKSLLVASAPELLEACRIAAAWIDDALLDFDLQDNGTLAEVRAAIAKAEGR